jgi:HK97 family phage prohead protease
MSALIIERSVPLLDIEINRSGDGRTVTAYAATFGQPYPVVDQEGDYDELINRAAFNRELGRGFAHVSVVYNHGMTLWGTPSETDSVPVGVPLEVRADGTGLLTVTRYGKSARAEEVLQSVHDGLVRFMSFRGPVYQSAPARRQPSGRTLIERMQLGLREYGPTPFPANDAARIVAVRSTALADQIASLSDDQRQALAHILTTSPTPSSTPHDEATEPTPATPLDAGTDPSQEAEPDDQWSVELAEIAAAVRRRRVV